MDLILNDLSLRGQFAGIDDFEDYFIEYLNELIKFIIDRKIPLLKKSDTYNRKITKDITMETYLRRASNNPVATLIKKIIVDLAYSEPYWDKDGVMMSKPGIDYRYPDKQSEPNCFTEAIERRCPLVVMQEKDNFKGTIECYRDEEPVDVTNIRDAKTFLDAYLMDDVGNIRFVIEHCRGSKAVKCAEVSGKCYTEKVLLENGLSEQDIRKFADNIQTLINDKSSGRKTHWWDSIKGDLCEYRLSISNGRELRVLFYWGEELVFLNGFIKKTEKTPPKEIELAERIKNQWIQ